MLEAARNWNFSNYIEIHMSNIDISVSVLAYLPEASFGYVSLMKAHNDVDSTSKLTRP